MGKKLFYVDTCIWLNLFKKESNPRTGKLYWEIARDFVEQISISSDGEILYSGLILKELKYGINDEIIFKQKLLFFNELKCTFITLVNCDYVFARELESRINFVLSFYDCLHIAVCKRMQCTLVTRDNLLIKHAREFVSVLKPEDLLSYSKSHK